ncbi:glycosyl transferase [Subtercola sp. Z020]|uniref:glycosyltransferase family 39 protein n=1 Tax=Subtercola sp. Z020 TaxID=2080582 RepID=UPI000CE7F7FD|nr:glycosyltransferase family 39 protein [Subtercola sp. Z020]PPF76799.1 glycosyl transferase [Subtercola sp. Z020]
MTSSTLPHPGAPSAPGSPIGGAAVRRRLRTAGRAVLRGRATHAAWERPAFLGLLLVTAIAYFSNLTSSGYANEFYSAAVQAGSTNWEAFLFGSSDAGNSITVDKPPASLWVMALSVRLFGLSSFSILMPEVIMGIVTVALVYVIVRRHFSAGAALLAGGVLASTPVAALMFRFNNPDALLVLLMTASVYFTLRAIESGRVRWLLLAGAMVGFGFLTKQLQAFVVLPPLALAYGWAAPAGFGKRILHLLAAFAAVIVSAGWWVAVVELVPASMRPYIGGSQNNDFLELTFGYNGFGRITGAETGSVTGGAGATTGGQWGATGLTRLFDGEFGGQIAWLIPAALVLLVVGFVLLRRQKRVDARRATLIMFGGWLVLTGLVFSFMAGIFHAYYTVALAPALAGTVGAGAILLWNTRRHLWARLVAALIVLGTGAWAYALLTRAAEWMPWLRFVVIALAVVGAGMLVVRWKRRAARVATLAVALTAALLAPTAYTIQTLATPHTGSLVTAGPAVASSTGFGRGGGFAAAAGAGQRGFTPPGAVAGAAPAAPRAGAGGAAPAAGSSATGGTGGTVAGSGAARGRTATRGGGAGGLLGGATASAQVSALLAADASDYTWAAATVGSQNAASYQLASQAPVMPLGGFNGSDPSPTLEQFQSDVAAGRIHYFISSGSVGTPNGGSSVSSEIAAWVEATFTPTTVDGTTLYDLTTPSAAA